MHARTHAHAHTHTHTHTQTHNTLIEDGEMEGFVLSMYTEEVRERFREGKEN